MSQLLSIPAGMVFVSLGEEVLPLLKRGYLPLYSVRDAGIIWHREESKVSSAARVSEQDYRAHLNAEYERLPPTLKGLLTLEAFMLQAEKKRVDIEAALLKQKQELQAKNIGSSADWLLQRFYTQAHSFFSWHQAGGLARIWLGINPAQWSEVQLQAVDYLQTMPASFPQRLLADKEELAALNEQRIVIAKKAVEKTITVNGKEQGLIKLPPKALRCVLFGADVRPAFKRGFLDYWQYDFRYQRIPVAAMTFIDERFEWQFELLGRS